MKKSKYFILIIGVLIIAAIAAPSAFAALTGNNMSPNNMDQSNMGAYNYQDIMVKPADVTFTSTGTDQNMTDSISKEVPKEYQNIDEESFNQFHNQMFGWGEQWANQAQQNGTITEEQANAWQDHFKYMNDFHNQMGFGGMMGMMGGYGYGSGGYGMMGGYGGSY